MQTGLGVDLLSKHGDRQFCGYGNQYRTAVFVHDSEQRKLAEESKKQVEAELKVQIYTQIVPAGRFYRAEEYHQDFYKKNPLKYEFHRWNCGRSAGQADLGRAQGKQLI